MAQSELRNQNTCSLCGRIAEILSNRPQRFVHEFENSILIVGDHQFFRGYCVLLARAHVTEMHDLPRDLQLSLADELMQSSKAIAEAYKPHKMNLVSLGNQEPHLHWHLFPRYQSDPNHKQHPWFESELFAKHSTSDSQAKSVSQSIGAELRRSR